MSGTFTTAVLYLKSMQSHMPLNLERAAAVLTWARPQVPARCMRYSRIGGLVELAHIRRIPSTGDVMGNLLNISFVCIVFVKLQHIVIVNGF